MIEGKGLLAGHVKEEISLADAASQQHLNSIHAAGIVLADAHRLFIGAIRKIQQPRGILGSLVPDGQSAAGVTVEGHTIFPNPS